MNAKLTYAVCLLLSAVASTAGAQEVGDYDALTIDEANTRSPIIPDRWYRPVLAGAYAGAPFVAYYGSEATDSYWPVAPALLMAPSVHWASQRGWRAGISLVLQPVAAYTGWMAGIAVSRPGCTQSVERDCGHEDAEMGILVGYLTWAVADVLLVPDLKPRPMIEDAGSVDSFAERRVRFSPLAFLSPDGQFVGGLVGRF